MVTRIEGMADDHVLQFVPSNEYWEAQVPPDIEDGMYIVTLRAYDDAGNSTYFTTIMLMVDVRGIIIDWLPDSYDARWDKERYMTAWIPNYGVQWQQDIYAVNWLPDNYAARWEG